MWVGGSIIIIIFNLYVRVWVGGRGRVETEERGGRERENEKGRNTQPVYEGNFLLSIHPSIRQ